MAGGAQIHELSALVTSNTSGFIQGMRKMAKETREMRKAWVAAGRDIAREATRIEGAIGKVTRAFDGAAIKSLTKYEAALSRVGSAARARAKDLGKLEAAARRSASTVSAASAAMAAGGVAGAAGSGGGVPASASVMLPALLLGHQKLEAAQARLARIAATQVVPAWNAANEALGRLSTTAMAQAAPALKRLGDETEIIDVEFTKRTIPLLGHVTSAQNALATVARTKLAPALDSASVALSDRLLGALSSMRDGLQRAEKATRKLRKAWVTAGKDIITSADRIGMAVGVAVAVIAGSIGKMGLEFLIMEQNAKVAFETMLGDGRKAEKFYKDLVTFAKNTPFEVRGLIESSKQMLAIGFSAERVIPILTRVGDQMASMGADPEKMKRAIIALGQIQAKGRLQTQELLQLTESGASSYEKLATQLGITTAELSDRMEKGLISADVAIHAILAGMGNAAGTMDRMNKKLTGQISTLKDNIRLSSKTIVESLGLALNQWITRINAAFESGEFEQFIQSAAMQVRKFTEFLEASWPAIKETAATLWGMLKPILAYMKEHPKLLAMLIALKVTGMLGLNKAALSLTKALGQTALSAGNSGIKMAGFFSKLGKGKGVVAGLKRLLGSKAGLAGILKVVGIGSTAASAGMAGLVIAAGAVASVMVYKLNPAIREYNKQLARRNELEGKGDSAHEKRFQKGRDAREKLASPEQKFFATRSALIQENKNVKGSEAALARAKKNLEENDSIIPGNKVEETFRKDVEIARKNLENAHRRVEILTEDMKRFREGSKAAVIQSSKEIRATFSAAQSANAETLAAAKEKAKEQQQAIADAMRSGRRDEIERAAPGFGKFRDMLGMEGITGRQVATLAGQQEGVGRDMAQRFGGRFNAIGGAGASPEQLDQLAATMARMVGEEQRLAEARKVAAEGVRGMSDRLIELKGTVPKEELDAFWRDTIGLQNALLEGSITTDQFSESMQRLRSATDEATAAAERKAEREREDALIAGNFAKAGMTPQAFRAAVMEQWRAKMLEFRQNQWTSAIDSVVNGMLGIVPAARQVTGGLREFGNGLRSNFGQGGAASPGQIAGAWNRLQAFFSTTQGKIANLQNQLALNQQSLQYASGQNRREIQETIEALKESLHDLRNTPPLFSGRSGDGFFIDPGLDRGWGNGGGGSVTISLPNVTRMGQTEASQVAALVAAGFDQAGRSY